jgi:hypothetical protein
MMMLKLAGAFLIVMGTIWALQGLGVLNWPPSSYMIAQREWALYGAVTAVIGAVLLWFAVRHKRV